MTLRRKIFRWLAALVMLFVVIPFTGIYFAQGAFVFPVPEGENPRAAVLLVEFRGYGGSTGTPTEAGVITDGLASYDFLKGETEGPIGILAHSLGTGAALPVAEAREVFAVALESPFTSLLAIARYRVGWMPGFDFMVRYPFRNDEIIGDITAPILIIHGTEDRVIPFAEGEKLATLAPPGTAFIKIEGAGHNNLGQHGDMTIVRKFFQRELAAE